MLHIDVCLCYYNSYKGETMNMHYDRYDNFGNAVSHLCRGAEGGPLVSKHREAAQPRKSPPEVALQRSLQHGPSSSSITHGRHQEAAAPPITT